MLVNKITYGFVSQTFDTETGKWIGQCFVAGDQVEYEDALTGLTTDPIDEYLYLNMVQPSEAYPDADNS